MRSTMLFFAHVIALSIGSVLAAPSVNLLKRDLQTIQTSIGNVQTALGGLDTAVKAVTADPNSAVPILTASQGVETAIKQATANISGTTTLSLNDALSLQATATALTTAVNTTISDLVAKKAVFDQLGVSPIVLQSLQQQKNDSAALGQAIVSKVPAIGQSIAQQSIGPISAAIDSGISAFGAAGAAPVAGAPPAGPAASATPVPEPAAPAEVPMSAPPAAMSAAAPAASAPTAAKPAPTTAASTAGTGGDDLLSSLTGLLGGGGAAGTDLLSDLLGGLKLA